jgi:hypothetical protein
MGEKMMKKSVVILSVSILLLILFVTGAAFAQGAAANKDVQKVTMKGKIRYNEQSKVYSVVSDNPPDEVFVVNPNNKVLDKLKKSGKMVTIEGHYTIGADHLKIEKINGKKY